MPIAIDTTGAQSTGGMTQQTTTAPGLGKDAFLNILVGQLRNQNPLNPTGDQDFMAQMTAFSTLEQVTNLVASNERLNESVAIDQSLALIGHEVTYLKPDGTSADGIVEQVDFADGGFTLTIGGEPGIEPGTVSEVR